MHHWEGHNFITPSQAIVGAQVHGDSRIEMDAGVVSFAVFFRPCGLSRLLGIPVREFTGTAYDAALVLKQFQHIGEHLADYGSFEERVSLMENLLFMLAKRTPQKTQTLAIAEHIFSLKGAVGISSLASSAGLSLRQFERNFIETMGVAPKRFSRVARFQHALDAKVASPQRSWLEIAHDLHYHDQMHMIHDFMSLGGSTPSQLLAKLGDARPVALIAGKSGNSSSTSYFYTWEINSCLGDAF